MFSPDALMRYPSGRRAGGTPRAHPRRLLICGCLCALPVAAAQAGDARAAVSVSLRHGTLTIAATGRGGEVIAVRPVGLYYKIISDKSTPVAGAGCISVD